MTKPERRRFSRVNFDARVELNQDNHKWEAELLDISLKGLLLKSLGLKHSHLQQPAQDCPLEVTVLLSDLTPIRMTAEIVHQSATQLGLVCTQIDIESIGHLRRLIELNLGSPASAERELIELIHSSTD